MTDDNSTQQTTGDQPAVAEPVLTPRNRMSDDTERKDRAYRQAVERKFQIERLEAQLKERDDKIATLTKERDDAVGEVEAIRDEYAEFTNENNLALRIKELESAEAKRNAWDAVKEASGNSLHKGVTFDDLLGAANIKFDELKEIPENFTTTVIEAAKAKKPFLFASSGSADTQTGEVRQETAAPVPPTLKAFGGQAAGGGAAAQVKEVDFSDPVAALRYVSEKMTQR